MTRLSIRHQTLYTYERPVAFGLHRLLVRPRDSHAIRVTSASLTVSPPGDVRWAYDALGNSVWLMVEALGRLGYAARFVTGHLYSPAHSIVRGSGATHAWCEVFLPELEWLEFDPTNSLAESLDLIPVAVARTPTGAAPVAGSIYGDGGVSTLTAQADVQMTQFVPAAA